MYSLEEVEEILSMISKKITVANRMGELDELLESWKLTLPWDNRSAYETRKDGKIVVIGAFNGKKSDLVGIIRNLNLDKDRFEFCLEYNAAKTYQYNKLRYNEKYRVVMFGAVPHSSTGKQHSGSVIAEMQNNEGYPRVILLGENECKITKSNFTRALKDLIDEGYISTIVLK